MSDVSPMNALRPLVDAEWYLERHPDVARIGADPVEHYTRFGAEEGRDPNPFFDGGWYLRRYSDVVEAGLHPLVHYMQFGAIELRDPHPNFDAAYYVDQHPEAANNPLLYHLIFGKQRGWAIRPGRDLRNHLPSTGETLPCPANMAVDVIVPVYKGLAQTRRCLTSLLDDPDRIADRIIVVDDQSPEPKLAAWLDKLAAAGRIVLVRNTKNMGFVSSVNRGMLEAEPHDVVLLNSDTEVPRAWLRRLAGHAYAGPRVATVSPFSNNATLCGYPTLEGGPPALGLGVNALDEACKSANAGRFVEVPVTVGFCMYIRRDALRETGMFDAPAFGRGYGEEADFCMRATAIGWRHRLACDVYVYHEGRVSFGPEAPEQEGSQAILLKRYPDYSRTIQRHLRVNAAGAARFAFSAALFRAAGLPVILMVTHNLGGGIGVHIDQLAARLAGQAHVLRLEGGEEGVSLAVPGIENHPVLRVENGQADDLAALLRSFAVTRVHVHHTMGIGMDLRSLLHGLDLPWDVTVHDWYAICPQVNLLPRLDSQYCGEPAPAVCNACIGERPNHGATDILSWRASRAWLFREADRVICPSEDTRRRMARYGLADNAVVVPHEPVGSADWPAGAVPPLRAKGARDTRMRIAVLGVLADQKGAHTVAGLADLADAAEFELIAIGPTEKVLPTRVPNMVREHGSYAAAELPGLIEAARPHVVWFPAQWPETYSYTLSTAIAAGLPIVASDIGAFTERLAGRPATWLVAPDAPVETWLATFRGVRTALLKGTPPQASAPRVRHGDFYADSYLVRAAPRPPMRRRRAGRRTVLVIPERLDNGEMSPCAFIRLLLPLEHPEIGHDWDIEIADATAALRYRPDLIATQRYAIPSLAAAQVLQAHCRANGIALIYDLDDDLLNIPKEHPEARSLRPRAKTVASLVQHATDVWVSTPGLQHSLAATRPETRLVPNGLDERLWSPDGVRHGAPFYGMVRTGPTRILLMGTATHPRDMAILAPALRRLCETFGERVRIDVIGMTTEDLPAGVNRVVVPHQHGQTYAGFVDWVTRHEPWHIGCAPLADTPFNASKSSIKTLDYGMLGLAVLASDVGVYQGSLADGPGGMLVGNTADLWYATLSRLVRDPMLTSRLALGARTAAARHSLRAQAATRRAAWEHLLTPCPIAARPKPAMERV